MKRNLVANVAGTAWNGILTVLLVPVYVHFLGIEAYGLIGFSTALTVVLGLLDFGIGTTVNREIARRSVGPQDTGEPAALVRAAEPLYAAIGLAAGATIVLAAPWLATHWLTGREFTPDVVTTVLRVMGAAVVFRFPYALYAAALLGTQRHVALNVIVLGAVTTRAAVTVGLLGLFRADLLTIVLWELVAAALQTAAAAIVVHRTLPAAHDRKEGARVLREAWPFVRTTAIIGVLSGLVSQVDKLVVSKALPLDVFGAYAVAVMIGAVVATAVQPLHATAFPRLTQLVVRGVRDDLERAYRRSTQVMAAMLFPVVVHAAFFMREVVELWIGNVTLAAEIRWVAVLVVTGSAFYALTTLLFTLQLARGWMVPSLVLNVLALALLIPGTIWSAQRYGVIGPAAVWCAVHATILAIDATATHVRLLPGYAWRWWTRDLAPPFLAVVVVSALARLALDAVGPVSRPAFITIFAVAGLASCAAAGVTTSVFRDWLRRARTLDRA